jgi:hypothetical protein
MKYQRWRAAFILSIVISAIYPLCATTSAQDGPPPDRKDRPGSSSKLKGAAELKPNDGEKVDPTGTWIWYFLGRKSGERWTNTLELKLQGDKLTGLFSAPAEDGKIKKAEITNGRLSGNQISFTVEQWLNPSPKAPAEVRGNQFTNTYSGIIVSNTIRGEMESRQGSEMRGAPWRALKQENSTREKK